MLEAINLYHALSRSKFKVGMYKKIIKLCKKSGSETIGHCTAYRSDSKSLGTGKSLSEAFILTSTNPQYDKFTEFLCTNFQGQT